MATFQLKEGLSIAHKSEPIDSVVLIIKVLTTDIIEELLVVDDATRPHRRNFSVDRPALVPGSTSTGPDSSLQELLDVDVELVQYVRLDRE